jgi:hypothetical protein
MFHDPQEDEGMKAHITAIERRWLLLLLPLALVFAALAGAAIVFGSTSGPPVEVTYPAVQAGYTANSDPAATYAGSDQLRIGNANYYSYLSFPTIRPPAGRTVTAASLTVHVKKAVEAAVGVLRVQLTTNAWSGADLTRVTAPTVTSEDVAAPVAVGSDSTVVIPLQAQLLAKDLTSGVSLRLQHTGADAGVEIVKTGADAPALTVNIEDTPADSATATSAGESASTLATAGSSRSSEAGTSTSAQTGAGTASAGAASSAAATAEAGNATANSGADASAQPVGAQSTSVQSTSVQSAAAVKQSGKLVFAHYFPPYPVSLDNAAPATDYYAKNYLRADGENGKFADVGGLLRDRPLTRAPLSDDYRLADYLTEINQAKKAGVDGFAVDILGLSGDNWDRTVKLLRAAEAAGNFKIMLQPDMSAMSGVSADQLAKSLAQLADSPAVYRLATGEMVVSPFYAEGKSVSWWTEMLAQLDTSYSQKAVLMPLFLDASKMGEYASISYGFGNWGERDPAVIKKTSDWTAKAHQLGKKWMEPVSVQDERPSAKTFSEAGNTETLRASWGKAIDDDADFVLLTTWNDYSEGTSFAPSVGHGNSFVNISAYYAAKFKSGSYPQITDDTIYITHRVQEDDADPGYSGVMVQRKTNPMTAARNTVEVLSFLSKAATIKVSVGGTEYSYEAPAGTYAKTFKLETGYTTATAIRSGTVAAQATTKDAVKSAITQQDLSYHAVNSADG